MTNLTELTAYQANVFLILNDGRAGLRFRDDASLELIEKHSAMIANREGRGFEPAATAKAIIEAETCDDITAVIEGRENDKKDTARLDWLEEFIKTGMVEAAFEMDGGIHLTLKTHSLNLPPQGKSGSAR